MNSLNAINKDTESKLFFFSQCGYFPHVKQLEIHKSSARFRIVAAGARAGKSMLAGAEIAWELLFPDRRVWCVASQYELADKEFDWALHFLSKYKDGRVLDACHVSSASRGSRIIRTPWGSFCKTKSTEKPQTLLGEELDLLILSEASQLSRAPWERMLRARIGPRHGRVVAPSTPNSDAGLFMEFFENGKNNMPDWASWQFTTLDNPTFDRAEWEIAKAELDETVFSEQYEGKFVSRRGRVFRFEDSHIFKAFPVGFESWPVLLGVQRGYQNPFAVVWVALSPEREYWVFDELYKKQQLVNDIIPEVVERNRGKRFLAALTDQKDQEGISQMANLGLSCTYNDEKKLAKNFAIIKRVQAIQNALRIRENGTSKLHIYAGCENLINELRECKWPDHQAEEKEKAELEVPLTKYWQSPAALSYVIAFLEVSQGFDIYSAQGKKNERSFESKN